jgi:hypothetical protein
VFNYREKAGVVLELDEGTNNKMIYSSSDGQLTMGDIPRFGIEDKTTEVDRNVDMDNNNMLFDNTKKFQINGSDTLNYVSYTGENMGWSYENSTGNADWDDFSTFYYGNYVGIPQEFVNVHILIDGEETEFEYFLVDAEFGVYIGEKATDGNTYALAGADIIKKISPTVVLNVAEKEYEGESVLIVDESGAVKQTNYPAPSLDAAAAVSNTIYNKGIRLQNSGELSINLGVYPRQNEISIFDPNEPTLNRIAIERHNIAYTYQPGNVAFKIGFPTSGDGIYKTATFQNKTGDVALLSDVYGRYAERTDITASMSVTALNAAYPNAMGGFEVGCPNMTPPTIYKKMSNTTGWYVIQTTKI